MIEIFSTLSIYLLIIFEIILTVFCAKKLLLAQEQVDELHLSMIEGAQKLLEINEEIQNTVKKINKFIRIARNAKFHQIRRIISMTIDIVQLIILFKSLNLSKGLKSINFKVIKKLILAKVSSQAVKKILDFVQNLCVI